MSDKIDKEIFKLNVELARWQGLHIGTLKGILWWDDLPKELRSNLELRIKELELESTSTRRNLLESVINKKNV